MKKFVSIMFIVLSVELYSRTSEDINLIRGIQSYYLNDNVKAVTYLKEFQKNDQNGKSCFYLGNCYLNLKDYYNAIVSFKKSYELNYEICNSLYNMACGYSLSQNPEKTFNCLIMNYLLNNGNLAKLDSDPDLDFFVKSTFYNKIKNVLESKNSVHPQNAKDLITELSGKSFCFIEDSPSPGTMKFMENGNLKIINGGGYAGVFCGGKWSIDESEKVLILNIRGIARVVSENDPDFKRIEPFDEEQDEYYIKINEYDTKIYFSDIKLNSYLIVRNLFGDDGIDKLIIYHKIGPYGLHVDTLDITSANEK